MSRIVLAMQFWEGDKQAVGRNVRRIVDNEPVFRSDFEICLIARYDCKHDPEIVEYAKKRFRVSTYTSPRRATGWPHGCNELWCETMCEAYRRVKSGEWAQVRALFTMEGDCIPVDRDWLNKLTDSWNEAETKGKWIAGTVASYDGTEKGVHCNGNALFHANLFHLLGPRIAGCRADIAWDAFYSNVFKPHWLGTNLMANLYTRREVSRREIVELRKHGVVMIHGVKDDTAEKYADSVLRKS